MELADYLRLLKRYWSGALMIVLASNLVAGLYAAFTPPTYESTSQLYVSLQTQDGSASTLLQGSNYTQDLVAAFADLATSPLVLDPVVAELDLETSASGLARSVSASAKLNTPLINLTVSAPTADEAAILSNAVAQSMAAVLPELQRPLDSDISPVRITMTRAGQVPSSPTEPNVKLTLAVGLLVGVGLGITYAILRGVLDNKVRSIDDVEHITDKPVLGVVSIDKGAPSAPLAIIDAPHTPRSEEMRRLRTNVQFIAATGRARTIMVTSSLPAEGKSTTAANLALALADTGQRVLLVDADLRKPRVAKLFGLEGSVGLSTLFTGRVKAADCIQVVAGTSLEVITSGQIPPNPSELLGSNQMQEVLAELEQRVRLRRRRQCSGAPGHRRGGPLTVRRRRRAARVGHDLDALDPRALPRCARAGRHPHPGPRAQPGEHQGAERVRPRLRVRRAADAGLPAPAVPRGAGRARGDRGCAEDAAHPPA